MLIIFFSCDFHILSICIAFWSLSLFVSVSLFVCLSLSFSPSLSLTRRSSCFESFPFHYFQFVKLPSFEVSSYRSFKSRYFGRLSVPLYWTFESTVFQNSCCDQTCIRVNSELVVSQISSGTYYETLRRLSFRNMAFCCTILLRFLLQSY